MKKVIYGILFFLISLCILINISSMSNMSFFGYRTFKIASGSMKPLYDIDDVIFVKSKESYYVNDVVTYINDSGEYVTHRIINKEGSIFTLKGDANNTIDKKIEEKNIVGKVVYKLRVLKLIYIILTSVYFWLVVPIIFLLIIFIPKRKEKSSK
ncbi:MAG: signal peptidase I [Bacilli bacterium]|nr:signal peptidase I [Bacilli bacterium]